jgi:hypothetical protein
MRGKGTNSEKDIWGEEKTLTGEEKENAKQSEEPEERGVGQEKNPNLEAVEEPGEAGPRVDLKRKNEGKTTNQRKLCRSPLVAYQEAADEVKEVGQAIQRGRMQPRKEGRGVGENRPGKTIPRSRQGECARRGGGLLPGI